MGIMDKVNEFLPGKRDDDREQSRREREDERYGRQRDEERSARDREDDRYGREPDGMGLARRERDEFEPSRRERALALRDDFERWLQRAFESPLGLGRMFDARSGIDIRETDRELTARVETPGFGPEDLEVMVSPGRLTIRAERRHEGGSEDRGTMVEQRSFTRSVSLPHGLDLDHVEARMRNGLLTIRIPRTGIRHEARRIQIKS